MQWKQMISETFWNASHLLSFNWNQEFDCLFIFIQYLWKDIKTIMFSSVNIHFHFIFYFFVNNILLDQWDWIIIIHPIESCLHTRNINFNSLHEWKIALLNWSIFSKHEVIQFDGLFLINLFSNSVIMNLNFIINLFFSGELINKIKVMQTSFFLIY
jgi:hypothetical protein